MLSFSNCPCQEYWKMKPYLCVTNQFIGNSLMELLVPDQMERKPNYTASDMNAERGNRFLFRIETLTS